MSSYLYSVKSGAKAVAVAGTAEALGSGYAKGNLFVKAPAANTQSVYLGDSSVDAATGYILAPGEEVSMKDLLPDCGGDEMVFNLAQIYADAAVNGEGVRFLYFEKA